MFDRSPYRTMMRALEKATAYRRDGIIYIFVTGEMPTPCDEVKIVGTYPGDIVHIKDPGVAELFIKMGRKPEEEGEYCIPIVMPFFYWGRDRRFESWWSSNLCEWQFV